MRCLEYSLDKPGLRDKNTENVEKLLSYSYDERVPEHEVSLWTVWYVT